MQWERGKNGECNVTEINIFCVCSETSDRREITTFSRFHRQSRLESAGFVQNGMNARQSTFFTDILNKNVKKIHPRWERAIMPEYLSLRSWQSGTISSHISSCNFEPSMFCMFDIFKTTDRSANVSDNSSWQAWYRLSNGTRAWPKPWSELACCFEWISLCRRLWSKPALQTRMLPKITWPQQLNCDSVACFKRCRIMEWMPTHCSKTCWMSEE